MSNDIKSMKIGVVGGSGRSQTYVRALAQVKESRLVAAVASGKDAIELQTLVPGISVETEFGALARRRDIDALLIVEPVTDLAAVLRRAIMSDKHVLASALSPITSRQLQELAALARRRSRLLAFTEERLLHPGMAFLKWMLAGKDSVWRPYYLRSLYASGVNSGSDLPIAALVIEQMALSMRIMGERCASVSGVVARGTADAVPASAFVNLSYADGRLASLQVSTVEAQESREWTVATPSRTILLDECDIKSPLRMLSCDSGRAPSNLLRVNPPVSLNDWSTESTVTPPLQAADIVAEQCRRFVDDSLRADLRQSNASFWADVTLAWEAVEESIRLSGAPTSLGEPEEGRDGVRPRLRLIRGKGLGDVDGRKRPSLTLVTR
jgi:predicted dehydrogenase